MNFGPAEASPQNSPTLSAPYTKILITRPTAMLSDHSAGQQTDSSRRTTFHCVCALKSDWFI